MGAIATFFMDPESSLYNAATGNISPDQKAAIVQANANGLIQASAGKMSQSDALAQATSDVNATLDTFTAPGGLGITWTGAQPGGTDWLSQLGVDITSPSTWPLWAWALVLGGGGLIVLSAVSAVRR